MSGKNFAMYYKQALESLYQDELGSKTKVESALNSREGVYNFYGPVGSGKVQRVLGYAENNNLELEIIRQPEAKVKDSVRILIIDGICLKKSEFAHHFAKGRVVVFTTVERVNGVRNSIEMSFSGHCIV